MKWLIIVLFLLSSKSFAQTAEEVRRIMNPKSTYYEVLGVAKNATADEIKTAYRKLLKVYHPDRYENDPVKSKAATEVLKKVNIARDTLADAMARKAYDVTIKATTATTTTAAKTASQAAKKWTPEDFGAQQAKEAAEKAQQAAKEKAEKMAQAQAEAAAKAKAEEAARAAKARAEDVEKLAKAKAEAAKAAEAKLYEKPKAAPASAGVSAGVEKTATYAEKTVFSADGISAKAKEAVKFYEETARCGQGFFKRFVDVML